MEEVTGPFTGMKSSPLPSTAPKEKDDKHAFWQGSSGGKPQLWAAATEQSSGAEKGLGAVHWPGAPEL